MKGSCLLLLCRSTTIKYYYLILYTNVNKLKVALSSYEEGSHPCDILFAPRHPLLYKKIEKNKIKINNKKMMLLTMSLTS